MSPIRQMAVNEQVRHGLRVLNQLTVGLPTGSTIVVERRTLTYRGGERWGRRAIRRVLESQPDVGRVSVTGTKRFAGGDGNWREV